MPDAGVGRIRRSLQSVRRRLRLILVRALHPRARFGSGSDVRSGLRLRILGNGRVRIGHKVVMDDGMTIECRGSLVVGPHTVFGHHVTIGVRESVLIGRDCLIGEMVSIRDHDHGFHAADMPMWRQEPLTAPVTIEDDVWIGSKATVTRGVHIGRGALVGANSVVTNDVPAGFVVGGVPARVIRRQRAPE